MVGTVQNGTVEAAPGKIIATPAVRRIAADAGIDLNQISGIGIGGRITEKDVQAFSRGSSANFCTGD